MKHFMNWIEIPATDLDRAKRFYGKILETTFQDMIIGDIKYASFACEDLFNNGALAQGPYYNPGPDGVLIYLNGGEDLNIVLSKVIEAGGNVIMPKTLISGMAGYAGVFIDTEGNRIGVHSMN